MSFRELVVETIEVPLVPAPPSPAEEYRRKNDAELLELAHARLGYQAPPEPEPEAPARTYPLAEALRAIGCRCFSTVSVERYKVRIVREATWRAASLQNRIEAFEDALTGQRNGDGGIEMVFSAMIGALVGAIAATLLAPLWSLQYQGAVFLRVIGSGALLGAIFTFVDHWKMSRIQRLTPSEVKVRRAAFAVEAERNPVLTWAETPLANYDQAEVPNPVLALACEVAAACPQAQLVVHHTVVERIVNPEEIRASLHRSFMDPFLEVRVGDEGYFIAVWDEADYRVAWDGSR